MSSKTSHKAGIEKDFDVWCKCGHWTYGGPTRKSAVDSAESQGWKFMDGHWLCESCADERIRVEEMI